MSEFQPFEFVGDFAAGGEGYNSYYRVERATADRMYDLLKNFWSSRDNQTVEEVKGIILSYRESNQHASWEPVRGKLQNIYNERSSNTPISMIDLGGANGSVYYVLQDMFPDTELGYLLVEPYQEFVDDFLIKFPDQHAICADAEQMIALNDEAFVDQPYTLFFASLVLCMIKPDVVRALFKRVSQLTDQIVLADNIVNVDGNAGQDDAVLFDYYRDGFQWYFSHYYRKYFDEIGFEIVDVTETLPRVERMKRGFGVIHARRR